VQVFDVQVFEVQRCGLAMHNDIDDPAHRSNQPSSQLERLWNTDRFDPTSALRPPVRPWIMVRQIGSAPSTATSPGAGYVEVSARGRSDDLGLCAVDLVTANPPQC
jgi:hypothetical protein